MEDSNHGKRVGSTIWFALAAQTFRWVSTYWCTSLQDWVCLEYLRSRLRFPTCSKAFTSCSRVVETEKNKYKQWSSMECYFLYSATRMDIREQNPVSAWIYIDNAWSQLFGFEPCVTQWIGFQIHLSVKISPQDSQVSLLIYNCIRVAFSPASAGHLSFSLQLPWIACPMDDATWHHAWCPDTFLGWQPDTGHQQRWQPDPGHQQRWQPDPGHQQYLRWSNMVWCTIFI